MGTQIEIRRETTVKETKIETTTGDNVTVNHQNDVKKLLDECQGYHYSQSSNFSKLARGIVYGVIGTIWVISYSKEGFVLSNIWLFLSLIIGFVYLAVDVCHYFFDSSFYRKEYFRLEREQEKDNSVAEHNSRLTERSQKSFHSIVAKFVILIIVCILFIIGFCIQMI